jgi:TRAP-type C4-dicarboxylate transport system substrate-binding protein
VKKVYWILPLLAFVVPVLTGGSFSTALAANTVELSWACFFPPVHVFSKMEVEIQKEIEKRTNGRVKFTFHPGSSLLNATKMLNGVETGIADIGSSHTGYTRGRFPVTAIVEQPLGYPSGWVATKVGNEFWDKYKPAEWDSVHVLMWHLDGAGVCGVESTKKQVTKLEDLKGMTLRCSGVSADVVKALGGTPRDIPMPETYDALSKGVVDGVVGSLEVLKGWKYAEVCKYVSLTMGISPSYVFYMVMNKDKWNSLPPDIQKVFNDVFMEYRDKFGVAWDQIGIEGLQYFLSLGGVYTVIPSSEMTRWIAKVTPVTDAYIQSLVAKGNPAPKMNEMLAFAKGRITYWTQEQKKLGLPMLDSLGKK